MALPLRPTLQSCSGWRRLHMYRVFRSQTVLNSDVFFSKSCSIQCLKALENVGNSCLPIPCLLCLYEVSPNV